MSQDPQPQQADSWRQSRWRVVLVFAATSVVLSVGGYLYYLSERAASLQSIGEDLMAVRQSRAELVAQWCSDRLEEARLIADDASLRDQTEVLLQQPGSAAAVAAETILRREIARTERFFGAMIVDPTGRMLVAAADAPVELHESLRAALTEVVAKGAGRFGGVHFVGDLPRMHFDLLVPVRRDDAAAPVIAVLVLRIDAERLLLPLVNEWPLRNKSGEFQLARRDGDQVQFLTPLRGDKMRMSGSRLALSADVGAAHAVRGEQGVLETFDRRGVPVLAAVGPVPGTPWFLVAKIERGEAYAGIRNVAWRVVNVATIVILILGGAMLYFWRSRRRELDRDAAIELQRANRLYATLARANDVALVALTREELCERLCAAFVEKAGMRLAWIGWEIAAERRLQIIAAAGEARPYVDGLFVSTDPADPRSHGPSGRSILSGRPQICQDVETDPAMEPWLEKQRRWGIRASACVPVVDADGVRGTLTFYSGEPNFFSPQVIGLAEQIAADFTRALKVLAERALLERQSQALRESESRYRSLFEQNHAAVLLVDPTNGRIADANAAACHFYGYDHAALCRLSVMELNTMPEDRVRMLMAEGAVKGSSTTYHFQHRLADGSRRWVEVVSGPMQIEGRMLLYSIIHDETDRIRAERERRESDERLKLALSSSGQGIWYLNVKTGEAIVTNEYASMLGHDAEGFIESTAAWLERLHPDDRAVAEAAYRDYLAGRRPEYRVEFRQRTKQGEWKWILSQGRIVERDEAGHPVRMLGIHTDMTAHKQAELAAVFSARRTQALLELPKMAEGVDEKVFFERGLAIAEDLTGSCISFAHFVNPEDDTIELAAWSKRTLEQYCHASYDNHYPLSRAGIWADAMREKRPVVFNDYASYAHKKGLPEGHSHLVRLISLPVIESGRVVMMVGVGNSEQRYEDRDIETVQLLANAMWHTVSQRRSVAASRESEQRWRFALEGANEGVWDWNMTTDAVYFSARLQTMLGFEPGELRPHVSEWESRVHPDDIGEVRRDLADYLEGRSSRYVSEHRLRHKDGSYVWIRDVGMVMERDEAGRPRRMIGTHTDVSEYRRAQQALRESEARLRQLFDNLEAGVVVHGANTEIILSNPRACEIFGLNMEQMMGREARDPAWHFVREDGSPMPTDEFPVSRVLATRAALRNQVGGVVRSATSETVWVLVNAYPEYAADGQVAQITVIILDITDRKHHERQIAERETRWQDTLFTAMDGFIEVDSAGRVLEVNPAYVKFSGYSDAELLQMHVWDLEANDDRAAVLQRLEQLRELGSARFRSRHRVKDGSLRHVEVSATYSPRLGGRYSTFIRDVTDQQSAIERLRVQSAALESAANTIVITDATGRIEWVNDAFTRSTGFSREEALGNNPRVLKSGRHDGQFYSQMWSTITSGKVWHGELHNRRKDGSPLEEEAVITPVRAGGGAITHFVAIKQDITDRKRLEQQLLRSQRMEGIGMLAGGIAHDLNNVLAPILLSVELLRLRFKEPADRRTLEVIESSARRGAGIVKQVLTFARGIDGERVVLRPRDLIREIVMMIEETFPRDIAIRREVPPETPLISGDVTQLHQVLLNLAVNARDAMPNGGTITFHVDVLQLAAETNVYSGDLKPGSYVVLAVEDTGQGMPPEVKEHIFEPFFTTKSRGKGTGLGLPTVLGIVRSHGGAIDVRSEPGRGSEFRIYLPALASEHGEPVAEIAAPTLVGGGRTVLVVDDEPAIREVASLVLEQAGFQIMEASNGREALTIFSENRDRIDAMVTDIMMPLMTGDRAAAEILQQKPNLPILFMSGLMEQDTVQAALRNVPGHKVTLIRKPFVASDLLHQLARVLESPKG